MMKWAVYQHFEDEINGISAVGKQVDLIVLDQNPLKINKQDLQDIKVIETIKAGKTVFKR